MTAAARWLGTLWQPAHAPRPQVSLCHEFRRPPYGGGNQFMLALRRGLEAQGVTVTANRVTLEFQGEKIELGL